MLRSNREGLGTMIVRPNKTFESRSDKPNEDWYDEGNYVIDETKEENRELVEKIYAYAPYMELVVEGGKLADVIPTERPPEPIQPPNMEDRLKAVEMALIDLAGI